MRCWKQPLPRKLAIETAARMKRTKRTIRIYKCPHCGSWHITSQKEWSKHNEHRK